MFKELDSYVDAYRTEKVAGEPLEEVAKMLLTDASTFMQGFTPEQVRAYVDRALTAMAELEVELTDADRVEVLSDNFLSMSLEAYRALGEALNATPEVWQQATEETLRAIEDNPDLWFLEYELFERLNAARTQISLEPLRKEDQAVVKALVEGINHFPRTDQAAVVKKVIADYGWDILGFAKAVEACLNGQPMRSERNRYHPEVLAEVYLELVFEWGLASKEYIEEQLRIAGLNDSKLVGWEALKEVAEEEYQIREGGLVYYDPERGDDFASFVYLMDLFGVINVRHSEVIMEAARRMLDDGYCAKGNVEVMKRYGFSLYELARTKPDAIEELPEPTADELATIEVESLL